MEKKYYWLKLMKDFFTKPKIKKLRRIAGGDTYTIIYLKLQLLSLDNDGVLIYQHIEDDFIEEMALTIDEDIDNVAVTINYLISQGLIEQLSESEYLMTETQYLIGSETAVAKRVRKYREEQKLLQCNADVTKCNTEIEIEIDKETDKEKEKHKRGEYGHVLLTDKEFNKLHTDYQNADELIKFLDEYIEMKGYKAKNHNLAIRKWVVNAVEEQKARNAKNHKELIPDYNKQNDVEISDELMAKYFGGNK